MFFDPADFRIPPGVTHVCAGGETPFLRRHDAALLQYASDKSNGSPGRDAQEAQIAIARERIARMWQTGAADIGFVSSVAEGVSLIAESLDWHYGDNICVDANEYPSVVGPFAMQRHPPVEIRLAPGLAAGQLAARVDARTRVIAGSYVSYLTGERCDLEELRLLADSVGALLIVDYTQAAGYLPITASVADFAFSACYKWLLGMTGVAVAYWNQARHPDWVPTTAGWYSIEQTEHPAYDAGLGVRPDALRLTRGNPAHGSVYVLASALDYLLQFDMRALEQYVQSLTTGLMSRLDAAGIAYTTPREPARHGASVCINSGDAQAIVDALYRRGVYAWNGRGRMRFSFHGYNTASDVERIMDALQAEWRA